MPPTPLSAGSVMSAPTTATSTTAFAGTLLLETFDHSFDPGMAPSRLNAKAIRDALVRHATVQKNWPAAEINKTVPCQPWGKAWLKITFTSPPPAVTPAGSCTANRNDSRMIQPPMAEYAIDRQMPLAAPCEAAAVSSDRCADASKPVIVYCVSKKPSGNTRNQYFASSYPELFKRSVKTKLRLWCWSGTTARIRITIAAPATCHHTEMLLSTAIRCPL